jgi:hypothetical protein
MGRTVRGALKADAARTGVDGSPNYAIQSPVGGSSNLEFTLA